MTLSAATQSHDLSCGPKPADTACCPAVSSAFFAGRHIESFTVRGRSPDVTIHPFTPEVRFTSSWSHSLVHSSGASMFKMREAPSSCVSSARVSPYMTLSVMSQPLGLYQIKQSG
jgi:hypothetical protein